MEENSNVVNAEALRTGKEKFYLIVVFLVSMLFWGWLIYSLFNSGSPSPLTETQIGKTATRSFGSFNPIFLVIIFLFSLFTHFLAVAYIRLNGIKIGPNQFPSLYHALENLSARLKMKNIPTTFVINGNGVLNAFATRFVFRKIIVIYSDLAEALIESRDQKQLEAVLSHELGHQVFWHTHPFEWFLWPGRIIPFLGSALSRAREYSSDKVMKALIIDTQPCERALVKLAAGKYVGSLVNIDSFLNQVREEGGFFSWLAEVLSTHPHLPKRIAAIRNIK